MILSAGDIAMLEAIYALIPKMKNCKGLCEDSCTVIPCTDGEKERLELRMGKKFETVERSDGKKRCSALTMDGKCSTYDIRPLICRLFGAVNHPWLRCEHGCEPEQWLPNRDVYPMMLAVEKMAGKTITPDVPGFKKHSDAELRAAAMLLMK